MTKQLLWEQYKEEEGDNAYSNAQFGHYLHVEKFCTFVFTLFVLLSIRTAFGSSTKKVYLTKDNRPSRLTSVAHWGVFSFINIWHHTITKRKLYKGKKISYQAPFEKGNRVADYKLAWKWFVEVFKYKLLGFILSQL